MVSYSEHDPELAQAARDAARSRRSDKRAKLALAVLSILLAATLTAVWWLALSNAQLAEENASFGAQQQGEKKEIAKEASKALCGQGDRQIYDRDLCAKWAEAAQEPTVTVETAPPLPGGPSQADLVNAFRAYCAEGNCRGRDGQPPTPDDIAAAFVAFCTGGRCTGPAGKDAKDGQDGKVGESLAPSMDMVLAAVTQVCETGLCTGPAGVDGQPGAGPTQEMVLTAVQQVCAGGICQGPAGEKGDKGDAPEFIKIKDAAGRSQTCVPDPPDSLNYICTYDEGLVGVTP